MVGWACRLRLGGTAVGRASTAPPGRPPRGAAVRPQGKTGSFLVLKQCLSSLKHRLSLRSPGGGGGGYGAVGASLTVDVGTGELLLAVGGGGEGGCLVLGLDVVRVAGPRLFAAFCFPTSSSSLAPRSSLLFSLLFCSSPSNPSNKQHQEAKRQWRNEATSAKSATSATRATRAMRIFPARCRSGLGRRRSCGGWCGCRPRCPAPRPPGSRGGVNSPVSPDFFRSEIAQCVHSVHNVHIACTTRTM